MVNRRLNYLLVAVFLFSMIYSVNAKDKDKSMGIRAGYQSSGLFLDGSKYNGLDNLNSFYVGLSRDTKLIPVLHLGTGLEYFQNGARLDDDNKVVLHYLSVPLHLKVKLGPVFALTGFSPSFKISEKIFENGEKRSPDSDEKSNWFDIPFHVGVGVQFLFITVEARYHWGMLELNDNVKQQYFQIGAGISF